MRIFEPGNTHPLDDDSHVRFADVAYLAPRTAVVSFIFFRRSRGLLHSKDGVFCPLFVGG